MGARPELNAKLNVIACSSAPPNGARAAHRAVWLEVITLAWMLLECGVSLMSARAAGSPALLAFGSDSLVELLSAIVVLLQFLPSFPLSKTRAAQAAGGLLFALAAGIAVTGVLALLRGAAPAVSRSGMAITLAALVVMPLLATTKRRVALATGDRALAADAVQSATCAYLAGITLLGLALNALFHLHWADSVAALAAIPILVIEGRRALRGEPCGCC